MPKYTLDRCTLGRVQFIIKRWCMRLSRLTDSYMNGQQAAHQKVSVFKRKRISAVTALVQESISLSGKCLRLKESLKQMKAKFFNTEALYWIEFNLQSKGKGAMRLTQCEAPIRETRPDRNTENYVPYSFRKVCGFFNVPCQPCNIEDERDVANGLQSLSEKS